MESVVGGVAVASGGSSAQLDDLVDGFPAVRCWLCLCRRRRLVPPSTCVGSSPVGRFPGSGTSVGFRRGERPGVSWAGCLRGKRFGLAGRSVRRLRH